MAQAAGRAVPADCRGLAAYYSLLFPLNDRQREFFARLLAAGPVGSVLDVGCGTGEHLAFFSERGVRAHGLEPDEAMFEELQRRAWPGPVPTLARVGVEALPEAVGERVDLVLCLGNTLPHLADREAVRRAVRGMAAALAPRGRLVVQTVNFDRILAEGRAAFPVIERALPDGGRIAFFREYDLGTCRRASCSGPASSPPRASAARRGRCCPSGGRSWRATLRTRASPPRGSLATTAGSPGRPTRPR